MPSVVTESCIGVLDRACVEVCPIDCIYERKRGEEGDRPRVKFVTIDAMLAAFGSGVRAEIK